MALRNLTRRTCGNGTRIFFGADDAGKPQRIF